MIFILKSNQFQRSKIDSENRNEKKKLSWNRESILGYDYHSLVSIRLLIGVIEGMGYHAN